MPRIRLSELSFEDRILILNSDQPAFEVLAKYNISQQLYDNVKRNRRITRRQHDHHKNSARNNYAHIGENVIDVVTWLRLTGGRFMIKNEK